MLHKVQNLQEATEATVNDEVCKNLKKCDSSTILNWINIDEEITGLEKRSILTLKLLSEVKTKLLTQQLKYKAEGSGDIINSGNKEASDELVGDLEVVQNHQSLITYEEKEVDTIELAQIKAKGYGAG